MKTYTCEVDGNKKVSGKCLWEIGQIPDKNNRPCLQCDYYRYLRSIQTRREVISPQEFNFQRYKIEKPKPKPKSRPKEKEKEAFKKWADDWPRRLLFGRLVDFDEAANSIGLKDPTQTNKDDLKEINLKLGNCLVYWAHNVMPMERKRSERPGKQRSIFLPKKKTLNTPLYAAMITLVLFYLKGKKDPFEDKMNRYSFGKFVNFWIEGMGLSEVWHPESIPRAIRTIHTKYFKAIRKDCAQKGISLADFFADYFVKRPLTEDSNFKDDRQKMHWLADRLAERRLKDFIPVDYELFDFLLPYPGTKMASPAEEINIETYLKCCGTELPKNTPGYQVIYQVLENGTVKNYIFMCPICFGNIKNTLFFYYRSGQMPHDLYCGCKGSVL